MENKKYTIVMISDHPMSYSGVGLQTRFIIEKLLKTGDFRIISIGAAIKHKDYRPQKTQEWGDDVIIFPCDGYGNPALLRSIIAEFKPDALWKMTDPRFYQWLYHMENEVRQTMPILYNTIWDNYPVPKYNKSYYSSVDFLGCINKLTYDIVCQLGFEDKAKYIPHGVKKEEYRILYDKSQTQLKLQFLGEEHKNSFVMFYNSRNAMRKKTGTIMMAFKEFRDSLPEEERSKVVFLMHTPPKDPEGQDLFALIKDFDLEGSVKISDNKFPQEVMCELYNMADVTISLSSEEGFGLSVLESLMCGTPVICTKTGGMQDQVIDPETKEEFGFCVEPTSRSLIGSQITPYIWSDHVDPFVAASKIKTLYEDWKVDRDLYKERWAGEKARDSMLRRFNLEEIQETWKDIIIDSIEKFKTKERKVEALSL